MPVKLMMHNKHVFQAWRYNQYYKKYVQCYIFEDDGSNAEPIYSLVWIFLEAMHSDLQGGWDYVTDLVQTSAGATEFWLIVGAPWAF